MPEDLFSQTLTNIFKMSGRDSKSEKDQLAVQKFVQSNLDRAEKRGVARETALTRIGNSVVKLMERRTEVIRDPWLTRKDDIDAFQDALAKVNLGAVRATEANYKAEAQRLSTAMNKALDAHDKLIKRAETPNLDFGAQVLQLREESGRQPQSNQGKAVLSAYRTSDPFKGQPKGFRDQANFASTFRHVFQTADGVIPGDLFEWDPDTKLITNLDELYGSAKGGYDGTLNQALNINDSAYLNGVRADIELYNQKQTELNRRKVELQSAYNENREDLAALDAPGAWDAKYDTFLKRRHSAVGGQLDHLKKAAAGLPLEHIAALKAEGSRIDKEIASQEASIGRLKAGRAGAAGAGRQAVARSNRVAGFSNQNWLAWARDNGFDNLGHVSGGQYFEGPDDDRAIILFNRQRRSDPGSFRFRSARTGEVVQVELKDGTRVFGERLRRHAADKGNVIRVATKDGLKEFKPRDIGRVVVLPSDGKRPQRGFSLDPDIGRRSKRIWRRRADEVEEAVGQAMPGDVGEMVGAAVTRGGAYAVDKDGKYVKQEDFDAAQAEHLASKSLTARVVNGAVYLVDSQDNVYSVSSNPDDRSLTLIDPDASNEYALAVGLARDAKPQRLMTLMGDEPRLMTMDDLVDGKLPETFEFEGEGTEEEAARYDKLSQDFRKSISPEALGFTSTSDRPDPFAGQKVTNERSIAGVTFVDLAEDADAPEAELPEDPTAVEEAEAQELIDAHLHRKGAEVVFGGQEGKEIADRYARVDASLKKLEDPSLTDEGREAGLAKLLSGAVDYESGVRGETGGEDLPSKDPPVDIEKIINAAAKDQQAFDKSVDKSNERFKRQTGQRTKSAEKKQEAFDESVDQANKRFGQKADRRKKIAAAKEFMREKFPKPTEAPKEDESSGDIPTDVGDIGWDDPATYDAGMVAPAVAPGLKGLPAPDRDKVASRLDAARYLYSTTSSPAEWSRSND